jgi:hypothetical protein
MISLARTLLDLQKAIASAIEAARLQAQAASVTNLARANATTNGFQPVRASTALTPYIFPQRNEFAPTAMAPLKLGVGKPEDDAATARGIVDEAVRGKSIDQIAVRTYGCVRQQQRRRWNHEHKRQHRSHRHAVLRLPA